MIIEEFRRTHLPYCIQKQDDGTYIVLNRNYKPLGFTTHDHVDYKKYPIKVNYSITTKRAQNLSWDGKGFNEHGNLYLYNDWCVPTVSASNMRTYLKKIEILSKLRTRARGN